MIAAMLNAAAAETPATPEPGTPLQFRITEGRVLNAFHQQGPVAAHLLLSSGTHPRVLVAFPAGNSGVGIWFENTQAPAQWTSGDIRSVTSSDDRGRTLRGIVADVSIDSPLVVREAVLSSVRVLRDYQILGTYPQEVKSSARIADDTVQWARPRLDGAPGYSLTITTVNGRIHGAQGESITLAPSRAGDRLHLQITALTGEPPLTPISNNRLLASDANDDARSKQVLEFLAYEEKFLAGSWRFNTYFGRDTLMSLRLLMPALQPDTIERGLMSVLERLAPNGEVAHEEDIGEFAVLRHRKQGDAGGDAPIYDYNMIDDDFMLAPVAAAYVFELGQPRAKEFLAAKLPNGERVGAALVRNCAWVTQAARAFAKSPQAGNLISLKPGLNAGDWRDSQDGLGGGRYAFDVNAVFVPAALKAIERFTASGMLNPYLTSQQRIALASADEAARVWLRESMPLFRVRIKDADARRQIEAYATTLAMPAKRALDTVPDGDIVVNAIALDASYKPIPVLHSDGGFALLMLDPPAAEVDQLVESMMRPFPAGLLTDAGLLVANPVFADADRQRRLGRTAYHGTVVWSWQQALMAAGLDRQIARRDLPHATMKRLSTARDRLWSVIANTRELRASELWSWRFANGRFETAPFGQNTGDADESNAAQLWSTVYLAIPAVRR